MIITEAFEILRMAGCVGSQRSFSVAWLGRRPSYLSSMASRAATRTPSLEVLLCLYRRIREHIEDTKIQEPTVHQDLERLAERIWAAVMDRAGKNQA